MIPEEFRFYKERNAPFFFVKQNINTCESGHFNTLLIPMW